MNWAGLARGWAVIVALEPRRTLPGCNARNRRPTDGARRGLQRRRGGGCRRYAQLRQRSGAARRAGQAGAGGRRSGAAGVRPPDARRRRGVRGDPCQRTSAVRARAGRQPARRGDGPPELGRERSDDHGIRRERRARWGPRRANRQCRSPVAPPAAVAARRPGSDGPEPTDPRNTDTDNAYPRARSCSGPGSTGDRPAALQRTILCGRLSDLDVADELRLLSRSVRHHQQSSAIADAARW